MSIQANINQLLTMVAVGAKVMPGSEEKLELRKINKQMEDYKKQASFYNAPYESRSEGEIAASEKLAENIVTASERRFEVDPTAENYNKYMQNIKESESMKSYGRAEIERRAKEQLERERLSKSREEIRAKLLAWRD